MQCACLSRHNCKIVKKMLALFKIRIVTSLVISCAWVTVTAEQLRNSRCENNVCNCAFGTQEAVLGGLKYCLSSCPKHAVRLSFRICECRQGYQYIDEQRTKCVRTNEFGGDKENRVDEVADPLSGTAASTTSRITTNKAITADTNTTGNSYDFTTTTETISNSGATNTTNRGENVNVNSVGDIEDIYLWIGALVMALVLLVLIAFLFISRN
ncbi:uncharacterized protein LOC120768108 [Bactrocera tryoni]|uniref:uncharacterized protein LOC120768108 n=1 Tax=Bactrocera tryoni TaxID=59916 RepID=UPI001A96CD41|nr:uncharacterized protein LOC120768108 [Bactrocera tryoni]